MHMRYSGFMAVLERRVPVLFSDDQYQALAAYAHDACQTIGAVIRESVMATLQRPRHDSRATLDSLLASWDAAPSAPMDDWNDVKASFERPLLSDIS